MRHCPSDLDVIDGGRLFLAGSHRRSIRNSWFHLYFISDHERQGTQYSRARLTEAPREVLARIMRVDVGFLRVDVGVLHLFDIFL